MNRSFFARRSFLIMLVAFFLMPLILAGTRRALETNRNDVKDWLPGDYPETATHRWFQQHFPFEQFVLVSWEGCTRDDEKLELFARKLESYEPDLDELGITGSLAKQLEARNLGTRRAIEAYGDLRSTPGITPKQATKVTKAVHEWVSPFKTPVLTGQRLVEQLQARYPELSDEEALSRLEGSLICKDHDKTCLVVTLSKASKGKKLRATLDKIRQIAEDDCAIASDTLHMGGPPVDNVAIDVEGEKTLFRLAGLSAVVGLGISWLCFRSFRLTFLVFFSAILAAGIGLASVYFTGVFSASFGLQKFSSSFGTVDAILLSMPSLVYVLAISGAVHIINYYHDAIHDHGLEGAPERALAHGLRPCALAAITTALGLGSLLASKLIPIQKFGVYSAWAVLATLGLLFLFLPACLHYLPSKEHLPGGEKNRDGNPGASAIGRFWNGVGTFVVGHNKLVALGCLAVMAFFFAGLFRIETSVKLMKLFSPEAKIIGDYEWLEHHLGPLVPMEVVICVDNQKCRLNMVQRMRMARDVERAVERELKDVGGALSAATFAPDIGKTSRITKKRLGYSVHDSTLSSFLNKNRSEMHEFLAIDGDATLEELGITGRLARRLESKGLDGVMALAKHGDLSSIRNVTPEQAEQVDRAVQDWQTAHGKELWRVSARVGALDDNLDYSVFIHTLKEKVEQVLDDKYRVLSKEDRAEGVQPVQGVEVVYTGLVPLIYKAQHELLNGLYNSLIWAFVLIAIVMIVILRSPWPDLRGRSAAGGIFSLIATIVRSLVTGLTSMVPNIFPVVLIFGAMGWMGILVDVGSMMTASVALGVAVDDTIHYLTWYRRGLDEGRDRKGAVMLAYERCATAMSQTTLIGGLGLAVFAFSTFTPTQRFGYLMLTLLAAALVGDLIFLPAVLSGPIGRLFRPSKKKRQPSADESADGPPDGDSEGQIITMPISGTSPQSPPAAGDSPHRSTRAS